MFLVRLKAFYYMMIFAHLYPQIEACADLFRANFLKILCCINLIFVVIFEFNFSFSTI